VVDFAHIQHLFAVFGCRRTRKPHGMVLMLAQIRRAGYFDLFSSGSGEFERALLLSKASRYRLLTRSVRLLFLLALLLLGGRICLPVQGGYQ